MRDHLTIRKPSVPDMAGIFPTNGAVAVRWFSAPGESYAVGRSANLLSNGWNVVSNQIPATPPQNTLLLDAPAGSAFFRVEVEQP